MKIIDKQKIIIGVIMITLAFGANGMHIKNKNLEIEQAKAELIKKEVELLEAKKPSEIEIKYKNLTTAEKNWANYENKIQEYTKKKLELEPKIREMRADILGLKK